MTHNGRIRLKVGGRFSMKKNDKTAFFTFLKKILATDKILKYFHIHLVTFPYHYIVTAL